MVPSFLIRAPAVLLVVVLVIALLALTSWPTCDASSPHGARIGSVILIGGCQ